MSWYRWLLCAVLLAMVDGSWLALLISWMGFLAGMHGGPPTWSQCQVLLVASVLCGAVSEILPPAGRWLRSVPPLVGAGLVWVTVTGVPSASGIPVGNTWPVALLGGDADIPRVHLLLALLACVWLWWHGHRRSRQAAGAASMARSFRTGLVVFVLVLAFEAAGDLDLGTRGVLVPFFMATLLGMAVARTPAHGGSMRAWGALVGLSVLGVLAVGAALAALGVMLLRGGLGMLRDGWIAFARSLSESVSETLAALLGTTTRGPGWSLHGAPAEVSEGLVLLSLLVGAALFGYLAQRVLRDPVRRWPKVAVDLGQEEHEDLADGDRVGFAAMVEALTGRRRRPHQARPDPGHEQDPGIRNVFMLYARLLDLARRQGVRLDPAHTPFERARQLRRELPEAPVDELTSRFVQACYGRRPSSSAVISDLERRLASRVSPAPRPGQGA